MGKPRFGEIPSGYNKNREFQKNREFDFLDRKGFTRSVG